jgi:phosphatidylglycerol:prolipoprotein diacylglycerol transferase
VEGPDVPIWDLRGAYTSWGAAFGFVSGGLYAWSRRLPALAIGDAAAPGLPLALAVGRIGCFLAGCCYGLPTDGPLGMVFPLADSDAPRHATQLYEALGHLALAVLVAWVHRKRTRDGQTMLVFLLGYVALRFALDFLRAPIGGDWVPGPLVSGHVYALIAGVVGVIGLGAVPWLMGTRASLPIREVKS